MLHCQRVVRNQTNFEVVYQSKDTRTKAPLEARRTPAEFVAILSQHVLDRYQHSMRHFGLLAPRTKSLVESTFEDRGRGFIKGSIRLPRIALPSSNDLSLAHRLLELRNFELWSVTAEVVGLISADDGCNLLIPEAECIVLLPTSWSANHPLKSP
jgi:hypothetical protein